MITHNFGIIKYQTEDFIVKEKVNFKSLKGPNYSVFLLRKNNCSVFNALMRSSKILKIPIASFNFFGEKDKYAQTAQIVFTPKLNFIQDIKTNDFQLIYLFDLQTIDSSFMLGNKFRITVRKIKDQQTIEERVKKIQNKEILIPNYYDIQRFGKRLINHIIGYHLLNSRYFEATYLFLCAFSKNENHKVKKIRRNLKNLFTGEIFNINEAVKLKLPQYMDVEKIFLKILSKKMNYKKAWKDFPNKFTSLFKEAYRSFKFNQFLIEEIKKQTQNYIAKRYEFTIEEEFDYFTKDFPKYIELVYPLEKSEKMEVNQKKDNRDLFISPIIDNFYFEKDEIFEGYSKMVIEFFLGRGSFATNVLNFLLG